MLSFHVLNLYLALATGALFPLLISGRMFFFHSMYLMLYAGVLLGLRQNSVAFVRACAIMLPLCIVMLFGFLRSGAPSYALQKIEGAIFATLLIALIVNHCVRAYGIYVFFRAFIWVSFAIMVVTLTVRFGSGHELGDRSGRFLINGPIVFGWMMGLAAIMSLHIYYFSGKIKYTFAFTIFAAAIILTGSKGPLLALIFGSIIFFLARITSRRTLLFLSALLACVLPSIYFLPEKVINRFAAIGRVIGGDLVATDSGSIGIRLDAWRQPIEIFYENPIFGVGLGNWVNHVAAGELFYPHNFIIEAIVELGSLGALALLVTLAFVMRRVSAVIVSLIGFLSACLFFSGDLSYLRFVLGVPVGIVLANLELESKARSQCF